MCYEGRRDTRARVSQTSRGGANPALKELRQNSGSRIAWTVWRDPVLVNGKEPIR